MRLGALARLFGWASSKLGDDRERCIFGFWDGEKWRRVDPLPVFRSLEADPEFNAGRDTGLVDMGDVEATGRAVAAVRRAFGVMVFDGQRGLTETECLLLLNDFYAFCGDVKKKANHSPTSPPSMAPEPSEPESAEASITNSDSDCGCASIASSHVLASE